MQRDTTAMRLAKISRMKKLLLIALSCATPISSISAQSGSEVARAYREAHEVEILRNFAELLSYPNRARDLDDITRAAEYIRDELLAVGVDSELLQLEDVPPIVYGELNVPGATRT